MEYNVRIELVKNEMQKRVLRILGDSLDSLILYGSYARGDFDEESDMDFMVLVDLPPQTADQFRKPLFQIANDIGLENDVVIAIDVCALETFLEYLELIPYYQNIKREGVNLIA